jgi:hypothetical protein
MDGFLFVVECFDASIRLSPPMCPSSENTNPYATYSPTFELAYRRFGLNIVSDWKNRQGISVPQAWTNVPENLAPLPTVDGAHSICVDLPNMWDDSSYTSNYPSQIAVNISVVNTTMERIAQTWNFTESYGWDFPMLAMKSLRLGNVEQAVS